MNRKEFIDRYNDLTRVFLQGFAKGKKVENIAFSPFSILSMLSILADATAGSSRQEVLNLLYGDVKQQDFPEQLKTVREVLTKEKDYSSWLGYEDPYYGKPILDMDKHLDTANAVIVKQEYSDAIRPEFRKHLSDLYDGLLFSSLDLKETLKKWTSEATREMLPLLENIIDSESILAMINTVFFHAMWQYPYEGRDVRKGRFHNADLTDSKVMMLHGGSDCFVENEYAAGFIKEFQQCDYTFMALLPKEKGGEALQTTLETINFHDLMHSGKRAIVHTKMPEFSVSFRENMNNLMASLGIKEAFTPEADFSSVSTEPLFVDQMVHQAKIEVDRNGARAAAATALILCGSCLPEDEKHVIIDRPFVFAILNRELKIPAFVGVVNHIDSID